MKTHSKTTRGKGLRIPSRMTAEESSPFPWLVSEIDAALRSLLTSLSGPRRRPRRPLETNLLSRFRPPCRGRGGVHCAPLRRTSRLGFDSPCPGRGGVHCAPLRRTSRLGFRSPSRGRGGSTAPPQDEPLVSVSALLAGAEEAPTAPPLDESLVSAFPSPASPAVGACCLAISALES